MVSHLRNVNRNAIFWSPGVAWNKDWLAVRAYARRLDGTRMNKSADSRGSSIIYVQGDFPAVNGLRSTSQFTSMHLTSRTSNRK